MKKILLILLVIYGNSAKAQDPQISPYASSPLNINPGACGFFQNRDLRAHLNYKNQLQSILAKGISTASISVDKPLPSKNIGLGILVTNNSATTGAMKDLSVMASFGYRAQLTRQKGSKGAQYLCFGLQTGIKQKSFMADKLTTDMQYVENYGFDETLPSGESFSKTSKIYPDFNFGALWYIGSRRSFSRADKIRILPWAGVSIAHLTQPNESFYGSYESKLPRRYLAHAGAEVQTSTQFALQPSFIIFQQGTNVQYNTGITANFRGKNEATFILGSFYRSDDAVVALTGIKFMDFTFLFSYDFNTSSLKEFTNSNSGLEFTLKYVLTTEVKNRPFL